MYRIMRKYASILDTDKMSIPALGLNDTNSHFLPGLILVFTWYTRM